MHSLPICIFAKRKDLYTQFHNELSKLNNKNKKEQVFIGLNWMFAFFLSPLRHLH